MQPASISITWALVLLLCLSDVRAEPSGDLAEKFEKLTQEVDQLAKGLKVDCVGKGDEAKMIISPGDSVTAKSPDRLSVPTDGTPEIALLQIRGPIATPDGGTINLTDASVESLAQGSALDQRILFRLTKLSFRKSENIKLSVGVDGWVVGEDGIRGIGGKLEGAGSEERIRVDAPQNITLIFSKCTVVDQ